MAKDKSLKHDTPTLKKKRSGSDTVEVHQEKTKDVKIKKKRKKTEVELEVSITASHVPATQPQIYHGSNAYSYISGGSGSDFSCESTHRG